MGINARLGFFYWILNLVAWNLKPKKCLKIMGGVGSTELEITLVKWMIHYVIYGIFGQWWVACYPECLIKTNRLKKVTKKNVSLTAEKIMLIKLPDKLSYISASPINQGAREIIINILIGI